jgi:hypothetical protein
MEIGHSPINMFISGNAEPLPSGGQTAAPQGGATQSTSGPIPKFASARVTFRCELRNLRTTSNFMILVRF